jgi:hypothetical protein
LQGATTQSEVQKYHGLLNGLNGALVEVGQRANEVAHRMAVKAQQIGAAQQVYQNSQIERRQMQDYQTIDAGLSALPINDMDRPILWVDRDEVDRVVNYSLSCSRSRIAATRDERSQKGSIGASRSA